MKPYSYVSKLGISRWQLEVLLTLYCAEGLGKEAMTQTQIAATYNAKSPSAVSLKVKKAIQYLVSSGFVSLAEGFCKTGRCKNIQLTNQGR